MQQELDADSEAASAALLLVRTANDGVAPHQQSPDVSSRDVEKVAEGFESHEVPKTPTETDYGDAIDHRGARPRRSCRRWEG
jgi:hypothetical protein